MKIVSKINLLISAAVMSASLVFISCDKEKDAAPMKETTSPLSSAWVAADEMPAGYVEMALPAEWVSTAPDDETVSFTESVEHEDINGSVTTIDYYLKADFEGRIVTLAFSPQSLQNLGIDQNHFTTDSGIQILNNASNERGLIGCLLGAWGNRNDTIMCWVQFIIISIDSPL